MSYKLKPAKLCQSREFFDLEDAKEFARKEGSRVIHIMRDDQYGGSFVKDIYLY